MKVALGLKAHSGWAALIVLGADTHFEVIERRRIELVEEEWAKQPYHAAEELERKAAEQVVKRGVSAAHKYAKREIAAAVKRAGKRGNQVIGCGILMGEPMPDWTVAEILAVHFRMHKAEGVLFREALAVAARQADLKVIEIPEKTITEFVTENLGSPLNKLTEQLASLGKSIGAPWGKDQKEAALAAMIALKRFK